MSEYVSAGDDAAYYPEDDDFPEPDWPDEGPDLSEFCGSAEAEHASWLASLPEDIREEYLSGPYTGDGEAIPPGFTHHDRGVPTGAGFAAGGVLDQMAPGPWLGDALARLATANAEYLGESELIGALCGWQRQVSYSQAGLARVARTLLRRRQAQATERDRPNLAEHVDDEVAAALRLTGRSAGRLLEMASGLDRLPDVYAALEAGRIDWQKAGLLVDELAVLNDDTARQIARKLLARAGEATTGQLRAALARAVLAADPGAARRRQAESRKDTRVEVWQEGSGNAALAGRELRPADVIALDAQLTADARWLQENGVVGTVAELRSAAYIARLSGRDLSVLLPTPAGGEDPARRPDDDTARVTGPSSATARAADPELTGRINPELTGTINPQLSGTINLTMPLSAFAGLADNPGEVAGHGAADADTCRDLTARMRDAARCCLTLTGPDGRAVAHACARYRPEPGSEPVIRWAAGLRDRLQILQTGTCGHARQSLGYAPPAALRHLIEIRQRTCAAPGCRRAARRCDLDHTRPYEHGGRTCWCNLAPLCRRHHRAKQAPGWHLTQDQPGVMTWQLPSGRTYTTTGDSYPV